MAQPLRHGPYVRDNAENTRAVYIKGGREGGVRACDHPFYSTVLWNLVIILDCAFPLNTPLHKMLMSPITV